MGKGKAAVSWKEKVRQAAEAWDLPQGILPGMPHIELEGDRELLVDHHCGIIEYTAERVQIAAGKCTLRIEGSDLQLIAMNATQLRLRGTVALLAILR